MGVFDEGSEPNPLTQRLGVSPLTITIVVEIFLVSFISQQFS